MAHSKTTRKILPLPMRCPFCRTTNRDDADSCYFCEKDLSMLRLILHKARMHFNNALEFAERDRNQEAIRELKNALDLDYSHINSHVVLGTLYVKEGQIEDAESAWQEALSIDPRLQKAHQYLNKLNTAREELPLVRRQRRMMTALLLLVMLVMAGFIYRTFPGPGEMQLVDAWGFYVENDFQQALNKIETIQQEDKDPRFIKQADILELLIYSTQREFLNSAYHCIKSNDLTQCNQFIVDLFNRHPSKDIFSEGTRLRTRVQNASRDNISSTYENYKNGLGTEQQARDALAEFKEIVTHVSDIEEPNKSELEFYKQSQNRLDALSLALTTKSILEQFEDGTIDEWQLLQAIVDIRNKFPDDPLPHDLMTRHGYPLLEKWQDIAEENLIEGQILQASIAIDMVERFYAIVEPNSGVQSIQELRTQLHNVKAKMFLEQATEHLADGETELALVSVQETRALPNLDLKIETKAKEMLRRVGRKLAGEKLVWLHKKSRAFREGQISTHDARETLRCLPQIMEFLNTQTLDKERANLLFYKAMAQTRLGDFESAGQTIAILSSKYPEHEWTKLVMEQQEITDEK